MAWTAQARGSGSGERRGRARDSGGARGAARSHRSPIWKTFGKSQLTVIACTPRRLSLRAGRGEARAARRFVAAAAQRFARRSLQACERASKVARARARTPDARRNGHAVLARHCEHGAAVVRHDLRGGV